MEERKKSRKGFNILDVVLILLAVLCVVGIWQRQNIQKLFASGEDLESYVVSFEVKKLRKTTAELLTVDKSVYFEEDGKRVALGTIAEQIADTPALEYLPDGKGGTVVAVYPEDPHEHLIDVSGKIACLGIRQDGAFLLGGTTYLTVNQTLLVFTEEAELEIRITDISKKG